MHTGTLLIEKTYLILKKVCTLCFNITYLIILIAIMIGPVPKHGVRPKILFFSFFKFIYFHRSPFETSQAGAREQ